MRNTLRRWQKINALTSLSQYEIKALVNDSKTLGAELKDTVKTNQIRKFLDASNRLKINFRTTDEAFLKARDELQLLRPKLAYAVGRQTEPRKKEGIESLYEVIESAINKVNQGPEDFIRFTQLIESIVAYHKFAGGKDS